MKIVRQGSTSHVGFGVVASKWKKAFQINCIILAIVFIPLLQGLRIDAERTNKKIDEEYDKTTALVTCVNERIVQDRSNSDKHDSDYVYTYTFAYEDKSGNEYAADVERRNETYGADYAVGEQVTVYFDPEDPGTPVFKTSEGSFILMRAMQFFLGALGVLGLLLLIVPIITRRIKRSSQLTALEQSESSHKSKGNTNEDDNGITVI